MHSKKHLSFTAIIRTIADKFAVIEDSRAANSSNNIVDVMLSGLACMYFQSVSLLEFQRNGFQVSRRKLRLYLYLTQKHTIQHWATYMRLCSTEETGKVTLHSTRIISIIGSGHCCTHAFLVTENMICR